LTTTSTAFAISDQLANVSYPLRDSFVLDSGATTHVCNDSTRFINLEPSNQSLFAGTDVADIQGFGDVNIVASTLDGKKRHFLLKDVAYVQGFHVNVVSFRKLFKTGFRWDTERLRITWKGEVMCRTPIRYGQWVVEFNKLDSSDFTRIQPESIGAAFTATNSRKARTPTGGSADEWHDRFGHINKEALRHLVSELEGVELEAYDVDPNCENCRLTHSKRQPSRRPRERSEKAYAYVHFDLIELQRDFNGKRGDQTYILHFLEDKWGLHHVYHLLSKDQATLVGTVRHFLNYVYRQYGLLVKVFMVDNDSSLGEDWEDLIGEEGMRVEHSPPHEHDVNGTIERAGGVLTTRATALKLSGGLPDNVSAECYIAAGYLLNRIPTRRIGYRTPMGGFLEEMGDANWKPNGVQIRAFGCRAYAHNHTRNKLDKLDPKAHIGWLVGYESSNIWRIWIPSLHRVISTRDVKFDETRRYSDKDEPMEAPEAEEVVRVIEIPSLDLRSEEDSVLEEYELSIDAPADTIVVQDETAPPTTTHNVTSRYRPIRPIDVPTTQLPSPEVTPEPEQETTNDTPAFDLTTPTHESISGDGRAEEHPTTPMAGGTTEPPAKKKTPKLLKELETDLNPESTNPSSDKRQRRPRYQAYTAMLDDLMENPTSLGPYLAAFGTAIQRQPRLHRSDVPTAPDGWKQMLKHKYTKGFMEAARIKHSTLMSQTTWTEVTQEQLNGATPLPVR
jgi:hypothetical protein